MGFFEQLGQNLWNSVWFCAKRCCFSTAILGLLQKTKQIAYGANRSLPAWLTASKMTNSTPKDCLTLLQNARVVVCTKGFDLANPPMSNQSIDVEKVTEKKHRDLAMSDYYKGQRRFALGGVWLVTCRFWFENNFLWWAWVQEVNTKKRCSCVYDSEWFCVFFKTNLFCWFHDSKFWTILYPFVRFEPMNLVTFLQVKAGRWF